MKNDTAYSQDGADLKTNSFGAADGDAPLIVEKLNAEHPGAEHPVPLADKSVSENTAAEKPVEEKAKSSRPPFNSSPTALQDLFLNGLRRENIDVVLYFTDGSQERGVVRAF